jgi:hypothetical protein
LLFSECLYDFVWPALEAIAHFTLAALAIALSQASALMTDKLEGG